MKKIIALALAILMMAAIAVPAMATKDFDADANVVDDGTDFNQSIVELGVSGGYTITIPVTIDFDRETLQGEATITASAVKIAGDQTLSVSVSSEQYHADDPELDDDFATWVLEDVAGNSDDVYYMIYNTSVAEGNKVANEGVILQVSKADSFTGADVTTGFTDSVVLKLTTEGTSQVGTYQDTLTFTAAVVGPQNNG